MLTKAIPDAEICTVFGCLQMTPICGSRGGEFERIGSVYRVENCKIVFLGAVAIHFFRHF